MANKNKSRTPHLRIIVGLPNLQDQIRMVNRLSGMAAEPELARWDDLGNLLSELYIQLQHQKQVTVYRFGCKNRSKDTAAREPS